MDRSSLLIVRVGSLGLAVAGALLLGIDHSKYWHRVQVRAHGESLLVVRDGAGGQWAAELQAADGAVLRRQASKDW